MTANEKGGKIEETSAPQTVLLNISMSQTYRTLVGFMASHAPTPSNSGVGWFLREVIESIPMPSQEPSRKRLSGDLVPFAVKDLAQSVNAMAKFVNSNKHLPDAFRDRSHEWGMMMDEITQDLKSRLPAGYEPIGRPTHRLKARPLPWPLPPPLALPYDADKGRLTIPIRCTPEFRARARAKGRAYGGGPRGRLSEAVRCALRGEPMPELPRPLPHVQDMQVAAKLGGLRGNIGQILRRLNPGITIDESGLITLRALMDFVMAIGEFIMHRTPFPQQSSMAFHMEHTRQSRAEERAKIENDLRRAGLL